MSYEVEVTLMLGRMDAAFPFNKDLSRQTLFSPLRCSDNSLNSSYHSGHSTLWGLPVKASSLMTWNFIRVLGWASSLDLESSCER